MASITCSKVIHSRDWQGDVVATAMGGMGRNFDGGYAEFTCVPASQVQVMQRSPHRPEPVSYVHPIASVRAARTQCSGTLCLSNVPDTGDDAKQHCISQLTHTCR